MIRLPLALLATAGVLFVAGVAGSSNALVLASVAAAASMLVALVRVGNAETAAAPAAPATSPTTTVDEPVDEPVVVIDLAGLEAEGAAPAKATTKKRAPKSGKAAKAATAVMEDVDVTELLGRVQGLGPRRVETVAKAFGSTAALRAASKADLTAIDGIGPAIADRILAELG